MLTISVRPKKHRVFKKWTSHLYYCSASHSLARPTVPSEDTNRRFVSMIRYNCKGEITIKEYPDGSFLVSGKHDVIHPRKLETSVSPKILEYIQQNLVKTAGEIFNELVKWKEMESITQKQIYYYWNKFMARLYRRSNDQIESAVRLIGEYDNWSPLYIDEGRPKAIAVVTRIGSEIILKSPPREFLIDSTRMYPKILYKEFNGKCSNFPH